MSSATVLLILFALCERACGVVVSNANGKILNQRGFPIFMRNLYQSFMSGGAPFSNIVHSNAAFGEFKKNTYCVSKTPE